MSGRFVCTRCHERSNGRPTGGGGFTALGVVCIGIGLVALWPLILVGVLLLLVARSRRRRVCGKCESAELVPVDSLRGRELFPKAQ